MTALPLSDEELAWARTYFDVASFENERWLATIAQRDAAIAVLVEALKRADQFIANGIEFGFIRMPDSNMDDAAKETPRFVHDALRDLDSSATAYIADRDEMRVSFETVCRERDALLRMNEQQVQWKREAVERAIEAEARVKELGREATALINSLDDEDYFGHSKRADALRALVAISRTAEGGVT